MGALHYTQTTYSAEFQWQGLGLLKFVIANLGKIHDNADQSDQSIEVVE